MMEGQKKSEEEEEEDDRKGETSSRGVAEWGRHPLAIPASSKAAAAAGSPANSGPERRARAGADAGGSLLIPAL